MGNVVEKKKVVRERKRKAKELTLVRKDIRRTHARNGGRW